MKSSDRAVGYNVYSLMDCTANTLFSNKQTFTNLVTVCVDGETRLRMSGTVRTEGVRNLIRSEF